MGKKRPLWQRRIIRLMKERFACEEERAAVERYMARQGDAVFATVWSRTRKADWMEWLLAELNLLPHHTPDERECWCYNATAERLRALCPAADVTRALRAEVG